MYNDILKMRFLINLLIIFIVLCFYLWISIIDFKYKEIELWKTLLSGFLNLFLPIFPICLYGYKFVSIILLFFIFLWFLLIFINLKLSKEKIIGGADFNILNSQLILIVINCLYICIKFKTNTNIDVYINIYLQKILFSILIGLTPLLLLWFLKIIIFYFKNRFRIPFKLILNDKKYKEVPALISFIPMMLLNLYTILWL